MGMEVDSLCHAVLAKHRDGQWREAYRIMIQADSAGCNSSAYSFAKAEIWAAQGEIDKAMELSRKAIEAESSTEYSQKFSTLIARLEQLRDLQESSFSAEIRPHKKSPNKDYMLAWLEGESAVVLKRSPQREYQYFPRRSAKTDGYRLGPADEQWPEWIDELREWPALEWGPACILPDSSIVMAMQMKQPRPARTVKAQLYHFHPNEASKPPKRLSFCESNETCLHPSYDSKRKVLIYSSDRKGGLGGMDLWAVSWKEDEWGEPIHLGAEVNSDAHELFPHVDGDSLFYSSERLEMGYGGMDIYLYNLQTKENTLLPAPINSPYHDFGFQISPEGRAYAATNRFSDGRFDAIYTFLWEDRSLFFEKLSGQIQGIEDAGNVVAHLVNDQGDTLQSVLLNKDASFSFDHVRGLRQYQVVLESEEEREGPLQMDLFDSSGQVIKTVKGDWGASGSIFELLTPEDYFLERIETEDESILDIEIIGKYLSSEGTEKGVRIIMEDAEGNEVARSLTDDEGKFIFKSVQAEAQYQFSAEGVRLDDEIHIIDQSGRVIQTISPDESGEFVYVRIDPDVKTITLTNELRKTIKVEEGSAFKLPQVYFELNRASVTRAGAKVLDKLVELLNNNPGVRVELYGYTDSRGSADYNLKLSQRRIDSVMEYLLEAGIDARRMGGEGRGETQLLNHCADGVECSEQEHAINRRTELKIFEITPLDVKDHE